MNVKSKVYYLKENGNVILITPEYTTNFEGVEIDDFDKYHQLKEYGADELEVIELEFGSLNDKFLNAKSYYVDINSKELMITYYTDDELGEMNGNDDMKSDIEIRIESLEDENSILLLDSIEKDIRMEQLENDLADILLNLGGM